MKNIPEAHEERLLPPIRHNNAHMSWKNPLAIGLILLLLSLIIVTIILGSVPPVDRDALTHHLFVPKLWLQHGGIYEIPEIPFSYYPMNLDLLYSIPLYFGNDIVPKYIHYIFALLTAWLIYRYINKRLGNTYGLLGAIFFLSIPIIVKLSITVYVDLGLVFFTTASLLLLLHWAEKGFRLRYLLLAGLCCGLAAGTKYNGLISIFVLTLFVPIIFQRSTGKDRQSNGRALLYGLVFAVATFVAFSPWLIRNYVWTGNPIYPLHNSLFQKDQKPTVADSQSTAGEAPNTLQQLTGEGSGAFPSRKILYHETWWQALLLPVRFFIEGQDDNPRFFDGKLTPFLLVLSILAFMFRPSSPQEGLEKKILLSFALLYFFLTFFQEALRIRYIVPIVPPLVILSMYGLHGTLQRISAWTTGSRLQKMVISAVALCVPASMLWYNGQYFSSQFVEVNPLPYLRGDISRETYISTYRPEYSAIQWLNTRTTPPVRIICLFLGNRGYYMDFFPVFHSLYSGPIPFDQATSEYVLVRDDLLKAWIDHAHQKGFSINLPFQITSPLCSAGGHSVYARIDQTNSHQP